MAIVTHRTSKNSRYTDVLEYYSFKHKESQKTGHYEPILDENGQMVARDNYAVTYITAYGQEDDPELWATACIKTNMAFRKNQNEGDRKSHEYIISHPEEDRNRMSMEDLLEEGRAFAREYLCGYDVLIAVHRDTDNDHIHISINSVRALSRKREEEWMMRDVTTGNVLGCEMKSGGKHQDSPGLRKHMNDWLKEYTRQHALTVKDNNAIAEANRAKRHGTKNEQMRTALLEAAGRSRNMTDLQRIMETDYGMELKVSGTGKTISVLYPENQKYVRLRTLGLEPTDITRRFIGSEYTFTKDEEYVYLEEIDRRRREKEEKEGRKEYIESQFQNSRTGKNYRVLAYDYSGRRYTNLELIFLIAVAVIQGEDGLWNNNPIPVRNENEAIFGPTAWKVQNMLDSIRFAEEEGIASPDDVDVRLREVGVAYSRTKAALGRAQRDMDKMNPQERALAENDLSDLQNAVECYKDQYRKLKRLQYNINLAQNKQYCYGPEYTNLINNKKKQSYIRH